MCGVQFNRLRLTVCTFFTFPPFLTLQYAFTACSLWCGVTGYLSTEISTSKQKKFSLVTFVDTPGLVDGDMIYQFDVNQALVWLGGMADLIFVFFDPIGQALCRRTLNIVEGLNVDHAEKIHFYLTKADEAGNEADRQRVLMQIVQELCKRPGLNRAGFDMPTIFIPDEAISKKSRCLNQIESVCEEIDKCINMTVQNTLNSLEKDCETIADAVDHKLHLDDCNGVSNRKGIVRGCFLGLVTVFMCLSISLALLAQLPYLVDWGKRTVGNDTLDTLLMITSPSVYIWGLTGPDTRLYLFSSVVIVTVLLCHLTKQSFRLRTTLSRKNRRLLVQQRDFVQTHIKNAKHVLYQEYLEQSVMEHEL